MLESIRDATGSSLGFFRAAVHRITTCKDMANSVDHDHCCDFTHPQLLTLACVDDVQRTQANVGATSLNCREELCAKPLACAYAV